MKDLAAAIEKAKKIALISHVNPDGDTVGSTLGLRLVLLAMGKEADAFCESDMLPVFRILSGADTYRKEFSRDYDLYISVDCGDRFRLGAHLLSVYESKENTGNIDHHITNPRFAKYNVVRESSSTAELVYELVTVWLRQPLPLDAATCLYTGMITDTGNFMHSNTTAMTHRVAADLIDMGVEHYELAYNFIKMRTFDKTNLIMRALNSIRLFHEGKIAIITLLNKDFAECGCSIQETEGIVDFAANISGVKAGIALSQQANLRSFKVSLRSHGEIDVASAASFFGGGGHKRAAGCVLNGDLEDIICKLVKVCSDQFPF